MTYLVISSSLNPKSKSYLLARAAYDKLIASNVQVDFLDLRKIKLPQCDGARYGDNKNVQRVAKRIAAAQCIIFAVPIYNFGVASAAKNLIELTGDAWRDKTVGFLCAAGGKSGFMSVMALANSLMLDCRCLVIPRFVYADASAFSADMLSEQKIVDRIGDLVGYARKLTEAMHNR